MNRSFLQRLRNRIFGNDQLPTPRRPRRPALGLEALPDRIAPAVTASFSAPFGQLTVIGDQADNVINISRANDGEILINNGQVAVQGGTPTVQNTNTILALGLGGNDQVTLNEFNGALPRSYLLGGSGNDLLIGGAGADALRGETAINVKMATASVAQNSPAPDNLLSAMTTLTDTDESSSARKRSTVKLDDITIVVTVDKSTP